MTTLNDRAMYEAWQKTYGEFLNAEAEWPAYRAGFSDAAIAKNARIAALEAEIAALKAHIVKSDNFECNGEYPTSCLFEAKELLDERRALLNGGGK